MKKDDKVKVIDGPMAGENVKLLRRDATNGAWYAEDSQGIHVMIFDSELEQRPPRKKGGGR